MNRKRTIQKWLGAATAVLSLLFMNLMLAYTTFAAEAETTVTAAVEESKKSLLTAVGIGVGIAVASGIVFAIVIIKDAKKHGTTRHIF